MNPDEPIWRRYRDLVRRRPADDVADEVRHHLEMRRDEALRAGLDAKHAAAAARERFGDVDVVVAELTAIDSARERNRDRRDWLADLRQDVRFAIRSLRRSPVFAATAILTLAIAIGANTTIFSFVNALLLEPLPYQRPQQLVSISSNIVGSTGELAALRERTHSFRELGLYRARSIALSDDREATNVDGIEITPSLISTLGVAPIAGTLFGDEASRRGASGVILLSHAFWLERYGGDARVVGRQVIVDGSPYRILGVMPRSFAFPTLSARFWVPITLDGTDVTRTWAVGGGRFVGRLATGVTPARALAEVRAVLPELHRLNPIWDPGDQYGKETTVESMQRQLLVAERPALQLLSACVVVVLLVACVNLANLMLARVTARDREFAVRAALGGGRGRLVRQLLAETVTMALAGGALGCGFAVVGVRWASRALPSTVARTTHVELDGCVLLFTAGLSIVTGLAFGLLPAFRAASSAGSSSAAHLGRGAGSGSSQQRLTAALVVGEVALAVLLAITAGLLARSFSVLRSLSPGFVTEQVMTARITPPPATYRDTGRVTTLYNTLMSRVGALPGVTSVGIVNRLPIARPIYGMGMRIQGQFEDGRQLLPTADHVLTVSPGYLSTVGLSIVRGRDFTESDRAGAQRVALVSRALARRFWPNEDPIGKRIGYPYDSPWLTIVGVVPDVRLDSLRDTTAIAVYVPFAQRASRSAEMALVVRTNASAPIMTQEILDAVRALDRTIPVSEIRPMNEVLSSSVATPRFMTTLVAGFALAGLLLGATGIYGVMSYVVSRRTHEMGVRMALGATPQRIFNLVVGRGVVLAGVGALIGCALAVVATRALGSMLFGVSATDPLTFTGAALLFVVVAVAASAAPARRATRSDPSRALRDA